jgi:hypothetical protein
MHHSCPTEDPGTVSKSISMVVLLEYVLIVFGIIGQITS